MESSTAFVLRPSVENTQIQQQQDELSILKKKFEKKMSDTRLNSSKTFSKSKSYSTAIITKRLQVSSKQYLPMVSTIKKKVNTKQETKNLFTQNKFERFDQKLLSKALQKPIHEILNTLKIKPPEPKTKFYQFMKLAPFNRTINHYEFILHFLSQYKFFAIHPPQILRYLPKKLLLQEPPFTKNSIWIVEEGTISVRGTKYEKGQIANRQLLDRDIFEFEEPYECSQKCRIFSLTKYDYMSFLSIYFTQNLSMFGKFFRQVGIFKSFPEKSINKLINNLNGKLLLKKEIVYKVGDKLDNVYIVYSGKTFRKVIVQLDKVNRIPLVNNQYLKQVYTRSYEFKILFEPKEIFGFHQLINGEQYRNQTIQVEQNSLLLYINMNVFNQVLQQHLVQRLKAQKAKKYPENYDKLCQRFRQQKQAFKFIQNIKIKALRQNCRYGSSLEVEKKLNRIQRFINKSIKKIGDNERISYIKTESRPILTKNVYQ